jgi:hypothetical protein
MPVEHLPEKRQSVRPTKLTVVALAGVVLVLVVVAVVVGLAMRGNSDCPSQREKGEVSDRCF